MCQSESFKYLKKICKLDNKQYVISKTLNNYVVNQSEWKNLVSNMVYIFVGDNPGVIEEEHGEYFYYNMNDKVKSKTGENAHKFIQNFLKISAKETKQKILFLNKSLKSTKETKTLYNEENLEDESLTLIANLINAIVKENENVFVCLFGIDSFHAEYFFTFVEQIKGVDRLGLYPHPSRRQPISLKEQDEVDGKFDKDKFFKAYGKIRLRDEIKYNLIEKCKEALKNNEDGL